MLWQGWWVSAGLPEEGVVFDADLPQALRGTMVGQLEADSALKLLVLRCRGVWACVRRGKVKGVKGKQSGSVLLDRQFDKV